MIIQFSHNGGELPLTRRSKLHTEHYLFDPIPANTGVRYWNNLDNHKRKFISHPGWFVDPLNAQPIKTDLNFWGEWEPQSRFELTDKKNRPELPNAIHYPMISSRGLGKHNTDPFVFGDHFYYTNCKQKQTRAGKKMLSLSHNSIIIFGSEKNKSKFLIDTVFVVDNSESMLQYKMHPNLYPNTLRKATLDLNGGLDYWHVLYKGKMYDIALSFKENLNSTFCFVPCKTAKESILFERPEIDWKKFNLQKPGAGSVLYEIKSTSKTSFWNDLVTEITKQGFSLGIRFDDLKDNDLETIPEYEIKAKGC